MSRNKYILRSPCLLGLCLLVVLSAPVRAGDVPGTLKQAFDAAWLRQPEAQSLELRRAAAAARRQHADSWTAEPRCRHPCAARN